MNDDTQITLRETIENAVSDVTTPAETKTPVTETKTVPNETVRAEGQTAAERARDEKGRFTASEAQKAAAGAPGATAPTTAATEPAAVQRPQRPSSWKKDYWDHWDKLDPNLAIYLAERERQYASGVSTYKNEYEQAKPFKEAIEPFLPTLQQAGITPQQWLSEAGNAYQMLTQGTPEQKLGLVVQLAQQHGIPLQQLFAQGQDGKIYLNPNINMQPRQQQQQAPQPTDVRKIVQEIFEEQNATQQIAQFSTDGKHPHFDAVRETMAGLLQAGLAANLEEAYATAIRMPKHSDIAEQLQQQQAENDENAKREAAAKLAATARAKAVSPKSSSPAGAGKSGNSNDIRSVISSAFDEIANG